MNTALYLVCRRLNEGWAGLIVWTTDLVRSDREMRLKVSSECDTDVPGCLSTGEHLVLAHVGLVSIGVHYWQSTQLTTHTATQFVLQLITVQHLHCKWDTHMSHHILSGKPVRSCLLQIRLSLYHSFIDFWHAQPGPCSAKRRHQSPERAILSHVKMTCCCMSLYTEVKCECNE